VTSPAEIGNVGDLQVDQDMAFHKRMWTVQRLGWVVCTFVLAAAAVGLLGDGPMAERSAKAGDVLEVRYGRIERHRSPSKMSVWVSTDVADAGVVEVWLDRVFADRLRIDSVTPEPESVTTSATRVTYTFEVDEAQPRAHISYAVDHQGIGPQRGEVGIVGGRTVGFGQFVLP